MPIRIIHGPSLADVGNVVRGAALQAGMAQAAKEQQDFSLQVAELQQRENAQQRSIAAQFGLAANRLAGNRQLQEREFELRGIQQGKAIEAQKDLAKVAQENILDRELQVIRAKAAEDRRGKKEVSQRRLQVMKDEVEKSVAAIEKAEADGLIDVQEADRLILMKRSSLDNIKAKSRINLNFWNEKTGMYTDPRNGLQVPMIANIDKDGKVTLTNPNETLDLQKMRLQAEQARTLTAFVNNRIKTATEMDINITSQEAAEEAMSLMGMDTDDPANIELIEQMGVLSKARKERIAREERIAKEAQNTDTTTSPLQQSSQGSPSSPETLQSEQGTIDSPIKPQSREDLPNTVPPGAFFIDPVTGKLGQNTNKRQQGFFSEAEARREGVKPGEMYLNVFTKQQEMMTARSPGEITRSIFGREGI